MSDMTNMKNKFYRFMLIAFGLTILFWNSDSIILEAYNNKANYDDNNVKSYIQNQLKILYQDKYEIEKTVPIKILAINDFHGQLDEGYRLHNRPAGSAGVLFSYLKAAALGKESHTFFVSAGDMIGASTPVSALYHDEPTILFFNKLGNSFSKNKPVFHPLNNLVAIPGNHEFDNGKDELLRIIYGGNHKTGPFFKDPYEGANFPVICSNILYSDTKNPLFCPLVIKVVDGVPVAFIGAVLKDTPFIVPSSGVKELEFTDEALSINHYVAILKQFNIHAIVVIIHQGAGMPFYTGPTGIAKKLPAGALVDIVRSLDDDVDVVIGGHTHEFCNAFVPNNNGRQILVTQSHSRGGSFADISLEIDRKNGDIVSSSAEIIPAWADTGSGLTPDTDIVKFVKEVRKPINPIISRIVGYSAISITKIRNQPGESAIGNLITDAQRAATGTDFAFTNSGGIRANIDEGDITWGELFTIQPFNNHLISMGLTGEQIYTLLNQQWHNPSNPEMLQVSGLYYTWDSSKPYGEKVVRIWNKDGNLDLKKIYTITVNSYLADGGDHFTVLKEGINRFKGISDLDALIHYIKNIDERIYYTIESRIRLE